MAAKPNSKCHRTHGEAVKIAMLYQEPWSLERDVWRKGEGEDRKGTDKGLDPLGEPWFFLWGWGEGGCLSERADDEVGFTGVTHR